MGLSENKNYEECNTHTIFISIITHVTCFYKYSCFENFFFFSPFFVPRLNVLIICAFAHFNIHLKLVYDENCSRLIGRFSFLAYIHER